MSAEDQDLEQQLQALQPASAPPSLEQAIHEAGMVARLEAQPLRKPTAQLNQRIAAARWQAQWRQPMQVVAALSLAAIGATLWWALRSDASMPTAPEVASAAASSAEWQVVNREYHDLGTMTDRYGAWQRVGERQEQRFEWTDPRDGLEVQVTVPVQRVHLVHLPVY